MINVRFLKNKWMLEFICRRYFPNHLIIGKCCDPGLGRWFRTYYIATKLRPRLGVRGLLMLNFVLYIYRIMKIISKIIILAFVVPIKCFAQPGTLDNTFGIGGTVVTNFPSSSIAYSIALQLDGKIVVGGIASNPSNYDFAVVRYNVNGSLDNTFNGTGKVVSDVSSSTDILNSVAIQPDGKILAFGYSWNGTSQQDFTIVRYNSNGSLDTTFDTDGIVSTDVGVNSVDYGHKLLLQSDGKIVACGTTIISSNYNFVAVRYNPNGSIDTTFGAGGKSICDLGGYDDCWAGCIQADGKIVFGGKSLVSSGIDNDFALARLDTNGLLDLSFNSTGYVITSLSSMTDWIIALAIQPDGKILAGGLSGSSGGSGGFSTVRYNSDASLDTTFSSDGIAEYTFSGFTASEGSAMALQNDGKIVMAGFLKYPEEWGLIRYSPNGILNTAFGTSGSVITSIGGSDELRSMVLQPDGKILVVGSSDYNFAVARYNVGLGNGIEDFSSASNGLSIFPNPSSNFVSVDYNLSQKSAVKIEFLDMIGIKRLEIDLGEKCVGENLSIVNIESLEKGVYILKVQTTNGCFTRKFMKQ